MNRRILAHLPKGRVPTAVGILALLCLCVFAAHLHTTRQHGPERRTLRVASPDPIRQASIISPYGPGFEPELVASFCNQNGYEPEWITVLDRAEGLAFLQAGKADILVGFWDGAQSGSPEKGTDANTARHAPLPTEITASRPYSPFNPVRVRGVTAPRLAPPPPVAALADPAYRQKSGARVLHTYLNAPFLGDTRRDDEDHAPHSSENILRFPVFSMLSDGKGAPGKDILLMDPASYALWLPFLDGVSFLTSRTGGSLPFRWFWRKGENALTIQLERFWNDPARDNELNELTERYAGFIPKDIRQQDVLDLAEAAAKRMPQYTEMILDASRKTGVPPLFLVAIIYQESRFDQDAVSYTKVRGLMQITAATAKELGVDRTDPAQCIMGGARYLSDLHDRIGNKAKTPWDRWFMTLAAYNQGMSNLNRTITLAKKMGMTGDTWKDLKIAYPRSTTCRGHEARAYVERVRYYYFILHGLIALSDPEAEHFAPLQGLAFSNSSGF